MIKKNRFTTRMAIAAIFILPMAGCATAPDPVPKIMPGPQGTSGIPENCKAERLGDDALIGKLENEVTTLLTGCRWRIGERDGKPSPGTMDYFEDRRTLGIVDGKVAWIKRG